MHQAAHHWITQQVAMLPVRRSVLEFGARDVNGVGGRGVAPRVTLVSYNFLQDSTSSAELDAMVRGKATNMVSSNSWGDADDGTGLLSAPEPAFTRSESPWPW